MELKRVSGLGDLHLAQLRNYLQVLGWSRDAVWVGDLVLRCMGVSRQVDPSWGGPTRLD